MSDYAPKPAPRKPTGQPKPKQSAPPAARASPSGTSEKLRVLRSGREAARQIDHVVLILPRELEALYAARRRADPAALQAAVRSLGMMRVSLEVGRASVQHASDAAAPDEHAQLQDAMIRASECIGRIANATGSDVPFASVDGDRIRDTGQVEALVTNAAAGAAAHEGDPTMSGFRVGPLVEKGGAPCDLAPGATGCVLDPGRRKLVIDEYWSRLHAAQAEFHGALAELRVEALLEKAGSDDVSWVGTLFLDVLSTLVTGKLGIAFKLGRAAAGLAAGNDSSDDKRVDGIIKAAVGVAKKAIKPAPRPTNPKVTFLDLFREQVNGLFAYLRYKVPSQVNDLELLALDEAFREEHHQLAAYKLALLEKLERARASGLEKIGRRYEDARDGRRVIRDVGVVLRLYASGRSDVAYQHQDGYRPAQDHYRRPGPVPVEHELRDVSRSALGARSTRTFGPSRPFTDEPVPGLSDDPAGLEVVPPEFVASALALHHRAWGSAPPVVFVDDRAAAQVPDGAR